MWIPILIGIAVLSVLLFTHELGHFITAKASGVRVEEFGLGFPPRLFSFKWRETRYSLNAIPFGGFNKLTGEEDPKEPMSLAGKNRGIRLLVISAGSIMNFLLALLLASIAFMIPRDTLLGQVQVEEVAANSPAAMAGIRPGDIVLSVNGETVRNNAELHYNIQLNLGEEIALLVQHSDATQEQIEVVPRRNPPEGEGAVGIAIKTINATTISQSYPFWRAIPLGFGRLIEYMVMYKDGLASIFTGEATASFFGPVGIAQLTGEVAEAGGIRSLLEVSALISLLLGIFNLLPLPAIDGGRIVFVFLEWIRRGKRVPPRTEALVHLVGFALLMVFAVAITYQDIVRLISGESLLP
jgi:regulator of sigma E protease